MGLLTVGVVVGLVLTVGATWKFDSIAINTPVLKYIGAVNDVVFYVSQALWQASNVILKGNWETSNVLELILSIANSPYIWSEHS